MASHDLDFGAPDMHHDAYDHAPEDENEPTPLEYARAIGFCKDFLLDDPKGLPALSLLPWSTANDLDDSPGAKPVYDGPAPELAKEKLECSKEGGQLLMKLLSGESHHSLDYIPDTEPRKKMRIELPLLMNDHELDMLKFCRPREEVNFRDLKMPLEHIDVNADEGMDWSPQQLDLPAKFARELREEHLVMPKDTLAYVSKLANGEGEGASLDDLYQECDTYKKPKAHLLISPPLTPTLSPNLAPFDPSSETGELPLLSEDSNSLTAEAADLDAMLLHHDRVRAPNFNSSDDPDFMDIDTLTTMYSPLQSDLKSVLSSPPLKRKIEDLKVEVPLMASDGTSSSASKKRKTVSFATKLSTEIPGVTELRAIAHLAPTSEESEDPMESFIKDFIVEGALEADRKLEQEQLQAEDTLHRVNVPVMDFRIPDPPWKLFAVGNARLANMKDAWEGRKAEIQQRVNVLADYGPWKTSAKQERQLHPFPFNAELGKPPPEPPINDSRYMAVIMSDMSLEDVVRSDDLVWKPDGLRIMDRYKHQFEDELEPLEIQDVELDFNKFDDLLYKRQQELLQSTTPSNLVPQRRVSSGRQNAAVTVNSTRPPTSGLLGGGPEMQKSNASSFFGNGFTTASSLHNFMSNMGQKYKPKEEPTKLNGGQRDVSARTTIKPALMEISHPQDDKCAMRKTDSIATNYVLGQGNKNDKVNEPPGESRSPLALPTVPSRPDRAVVLSLALLQTHRNVLRRVFKGLYPNAHHIERDFGAVEKAPGADMIVSPGTGLVLTTLQKLKQKSLPGQAVQLNGVRDRINRLSARYELIVVLVGDALVADGVAMDQRDCDALADFAAFCAQSKTEVQVTLVPTGDEALASWIAASIHEYGDTGQEMALLAEETVWEQLLRRAGLNAYAAQSVLANLKDSIPITDAAYEGAAEDIGIRAFIRMRPDERIPRFASLLGGKRVLRNVNKVLEHQWFSVQGDLG